MENFIYVGNQDRKYVIIFIVILEVILLFTPIYYDWNYVIYYSYYAILSYCLYYITNKIARIYKGYLDNGYKYDLMTYEEVIWYRSYLCFKISILIYLIYNQYLIVGIISILTLAIDIFVLGILFMFKQPININIPPMQFIPFVPPLNVLLSSTDASVHEN